MPSLQTLDLTSNDAADFRRAAALPPYLGQVATSCRTYTSLSSGTRSCNSRESRYARQAIASLQIAYPGWYANNEVSNTTGETISASIEYPAGTFKQVTWSGATTHTVAPGTLGPLSDTIAVTIPKNAIFWVRTYKNTPAGMIYTDHVVPQYNSTSEFSTTDLGDKTMSAAYTNTVTSTANPTWGPCLMVANINIPSVFMLGDSITVGTGDGSQGIDASGDAGIVARSIGPNFGYTQSSMVAKTLSEAVGNFSKRALLAPYFSHVICAMGRNDVGNNRTQAQFVADLQTLVTKFPAGTKFHQTTITPNTTSTDSFATNANQTVASSTQEAVRVALNQQIRAAAIPGFGVGFDVTRAVEAGVASGKWQTQGPLNGAGAATSYVSSDGIHPSLAGYLAVRDSGAIDPAMIVR